MIPEKIKVAGITYSVEEKDVVIIDGNSKYMGACSYSEAKIELLNSLNAERKEETFVHELLHACFYEAGFDEHDEDLVSRVSSVLYQVLKDNKLSFEFTSESGV